jgi:hypothetical protein
VTREALRFGLTHGKFAFTNDTVISGPKRFAASAAPPDATPDVIASLKKAAFLGRWFAAAGSPANILATWGVAP